MSFIRLFGVTLALLVLTTISARADSTHVESYYKLLQESQATLASRYGLHFPPDWKPIFRLGLPDSIPVEIQKSAAAVYQARTSLIAIDTSQVALTMEFRIDPWAQNGELFTLKKPASRVFAHELAHAYLSEWSCLHRGETLPPTNRTLPIFQEIGYRILSEGFAETIEGAWSPPMNEKFWPEELDEENLPPVEYFHKLFYHGGSTLIRPLIEKYGAAPVADYVILYPLTFEDGKLRQAIKTWRKQAERTLKRSSKTPR